VRTIETGLAGVVVIEPRVFEDGRGFFFETYQEERFAQSGIHARFVQDNHSRSSRDTLRGLHYQLKHPQAKLCRVVVGEVIDVVADVRPPSPTFRKWISVILSAENKRMIYVPRGYAHGFAVLSEVAEFLYKCDDFYAPEDERGIAWDDPELAIDWKIKTAALSAKDQKLPRLRDMAPLDLPAYTE
jgi:dTDP-4-dehydrorhamnose 3,5-epimerase